MIDRPDWDVPAAELNGGEGQAVVPSAFDGKAYIADLEARHNGGALPTTTTDNSDSALSPELVREMHGTADGFEANLSLLKESATRLLDEVGQPAAVSEHFDALSPSIQTKVFRELWQRPGISFLDLLDVVEPTLTLSEAHEAEQWLRKLRGL